MKMKKFNFFKKLIIYSMAISFTCIAIVQILNLTFLDYFYIYRNKQKIPAIANEIINLKDNPNALAEYIEKESEESGIQISYGTNFSHGQQKGKMYFMGIQPRRNVLYETYHNEDTVELKKTVSGGRFLVYYKKVEDIPLLITLPLVTLENYKYEAIIIEFISIFITLIFSFLLGGFFSKKLTANIEKLNSAAKKMAHLEFVEKLDINSHDEIGELASSVEKMSISLKNSMDNLKNFVSNASHELKTPISIINMTSQNLRDEKSLTYEERIQLYNILIKESEEMGELIQNLMILSKISYSKNNLKIQHFNLKNLVKQSLYKYELLELEKGLDILVHIKSDFEVNTDYNFFKIVIDNLIQNAIKYSPLYGKIDIELINNIFSIKNTISSTIQENSETLFLEFKRGSNSLGTDIEGFGLGLSIVKNILNLLSFRYCITTTKELFEFKIYI